MGLKGALGRARRARSVEDIGQVPRRGRGRSFDAARAFQRLDVQDLRLDAEHRLRSAHQLGHCEHRGGLGVAGDQPVAAVGMIGVQGNDAPACRQHAQQRRRGADVVRRQDRDGARPVQAADQGGGDGRDLGRQRAIGDGLRRVLHRDAIGMPLSGGEETVDDRLHLK